MRGKIKQYNRMLGCSWHCYLSTDHATQLEVAATLGVSDSLVSDYRRRIEQELRALSFTEVEQARMFELALRERVRTMVTDRIAKECRPRLRFVSSWDRDHGKRGASLRFFVLGSYRK